MEEKNKYQEALEEIINEYQYAYKWYCQFEGISEKKAKELFENFSNKKIGLLKELVNKETPKEPIEESMIQEFKIKVFQLKCPICKIGKVGQIFEDDRKKEGVGFANYCPNCGQKLKIGEWGKGE